MPTDPGTTDLDALQAQFDVPGVTIDAGNGGLTRLRVATALCAGELYLQGAHLTAFAPAGHAPVLWMSDSSAFAPGKAIRGGVPICYPWFGANARHPSAPQHGVARTAAWELVDVGVQPRGEVNVILRLPARPVAADMADEVALDAASVETYFAVLFGDSLELGLLVRNKGARDARFEAALHTYFNVGDVERATVAGLQGTRYVDKTRETQSFVETPPAIRFTGETDRVYESDATTTIEDPVLGRRITNRKLGSNSTVVWNAWPAKAAAIGLAQGEWKRYVCVETAAVGADAVTLAPGASHTLGANISVEALA